MTKFVTDEIALTRFLNSDEWVGMERLVNEAWREHMAICVDSSASIEKIRFAQGAIAVIESFREMPRLLFTKEVESNGR
jgi:hypothetical protein